MIPLIGERTLQIEAVSNYGFQILDAGLWAMLWLQRSLDTSFWTIIESLLWITFCIINIVVGLCWYQPCTFVVLMDLFHLFLPHNCGAHWALFSDIKQLLAFARIHHVLCGHLPAVSEMFSFSIEVYRSLIFLELHLVLAVLGVLDIFKLYCVITGIAFRLNFVFWSACNIFPLRLESTWSLWARFDCVARLLLYAYFLIQIIQICMQLHGLNIIWNASFLGKWLRWSQLGMQSSVLVLLIASSKSL